VIKAWVFDSCPLKWARRCFAFEPNLTPGQNLRMKIGTYYYPEQWPRHQWERDFDNIAKMGLQIVHMGEFAWFTMEPRPGEIQLDWLSECVEMARARDLDVILCTPTAAPPVWLAREFPETLPIELGKLRDFGGRRHYSPTSPAMREATTRIVTALAERFGDHPSVIGWQIDNEYGQPFSTNTHTHAAFADWLKSKYGNIEELNRAWGCQFWNTYYTDFSQIRMPAERDSKYANPHHHLDASRFWSWAMADFNRLQCDILRPRIGNRFLTTNFMPFHPDANPADFKRDLSIFTWDTYPVSGWVKAATDETYRIADPNGIGFMHQQMASYTGRWALMEIQPGTINWSGVPVHVYPGAIRLWLWTAFGNGAEFITTYRYRQPRFGVELFHHGLTGPDGITLSPGGREFVQVIDEMSALKPPLRTQPALPTVGIIHDHEQLWYFLTLPQAKRWDYRKITPSLYGAVARLGLPIRVLEADAEWPDRMPLLIVPAMQMLDQRFIDRLNRYAEAGGHLLITCRTGWMDRTGQLWEGPTAAPILPLIGASIEGYDSLPEETWAHLSFAGKTHLWATWGELLKPADGTRVLATYADQFYAGTPAIIQRDHGRGTVTYCGVAAESGLDEALVESLASQIGLPTTPLPPKVHLLRRDGYVIAVNYQDKPVPAPAPDGTHFVVGSETIPPAGVAVWIDPA
jgi:beta-galactosidase